MYVFGVVVLEDGYLGKVVDYFFGVLGYLLMYLIENFKEVYR